MPPGPRVLYVYWMLHTMCTHMSERLHEDSRTPPTMHDGGQATAVLVNVCLLTRICEPITNNGIDSVVAVRLLCHQICNLWILA